MTFGMMLLTVQILLQVVVRFMHRRAAGMTRRHHRNSLRHRRRCSSCSPACRSRFALGAVATIFMIAFMPPGSVDTIAQNVYEEMASITLLSIPLFILEGLRRSAARAPARTSTARCTPGCTSSPAGSASPTCSPARCSPRWPGSSPATCSAIGSAGIPEMRKRGYSGGFAAGIIAAGGTLGILLPPSITMILYAVAAEQSLGRLFLAAHRSGAAAGAAVRRLARCGSSSRSSSAAKALYRARWRRSRSCCARDTLTVRDKFALLPRVLPFIILLTGVMVALYGGYAHAVGDCGTGRRAGALF